MICAHCEEEFQPGDDRVQIPSLDGPPAHFHRECLIRTVAGSVGHQNRRCSCYGGTEEDPLEMTRHEAARAACQLFQQTHPHL